MIVQREVALLYARKTNVLVIVHLEKKNKVSSSMMKFIMKLDTLFFFSTCFVALSFNRKEVSIKVIHICNLNYYMTNYFVVWIFVPGIWSASWWIAGSRTCETHFFSKEEVVNAQDKAEDNIRLAESAEKDKVGHNFPSLISSHCSLKRKGGKFWVDKIISVDRLFQIEIHCIFSSERIRNYEYRYTMQRLYAIIAYLSMTCFAYLSHTSYQLIHYTIRSIHIQTWLSVDQTSYWTLW